MPRSYTTVQGDMWDLIAYKVYRNEAYLSKLLAANEAYREVAVFPSGVEILCPDEDAETSGVLPPWRRGAGTS